jgi:hypothetical protein
MLEGPSTNSRPPAGADIEQGETQNKDLVETYMYLSTDGTMSAPSQGFEVNMLFVVVVVSEEWGGWHFDVTFFFLQNERWGANTMGMNLNHSTQHESKI